MSENVAGVNDELKAEVSTVYRSPFRRRLVHWTPGAESAWLLGHALGLFPGFEDYYVFQHKAGHLWSRSPKGNALYDALEALCRAELMERRLEGEDYEYRWKANRH